MIPVLLTQTKKANYFITNEEIGIMWKFINSRYGSKWAAMFACCIMMPGHNRIGEICAINLYDFLDTDFGRMTAIIEKSHIQDDFPIINCFAEYIQEYIQKNKHTFRDGYLFPWTTKKNPQKPYVDTKTACDMMAKWRKELSKDYPQFDDKRKILQPQYLALKLLKDHPGMTHHEVGKHMHMPRTIHRVISKCFQKGFLGYNGVTAKGCKYIETEKFFYHHRVSWHSLRRWVETALKNKGYTIEQIADIFRYEDSRTVHTYLNSWETWRKEKDILDDTLKDFWNHLRNKERGQTSLAEFN